MIEPEIRLRISVMGLFVKSDSVLMIHKIKGPQPDRWDLPGGGLQPGEPMMVALQREIQEETGLTKFRVQGVVAIAEDFFPNWQGQPLHSLSLIYHCSVEGEPLLNPCDRREVGSKGVQWLSIATLTPEICSSRSWKALQALESSS